MIEELDSTKENIQPLKRGRVISQLGNAIRAQSDTAASQELMKEREKYELKLRTYEGDDPLEVWYEYILWIEQNFPRAAREGNLNVILERSVKQFKNYEQYHQDIRYIEIWLKYIELSLVPLELFQRCIQHGIGKYSALFYVAWAHELENNNDTKRANQVLNEGIINNAQPRDYLKKAQHDLQVRVGQAMLGEEIGIEIIKEEQRIALNSLKAHGRKKAMVNNVRIGTSSQRGPPGILQSSANNSNNSIHSGGIKVYNENENMENAEFAVIGGHHLAGAVENEIVSKENVTKKPGPWTKKHCKQKSGMLSSIIQPHHPQHPSFEVHEDEEVQEKKIPAILCNALKPRKLDMDVMNCGLAIFEPEDPKECFQFCKNKVFAGGCEFSFEELRALEYLKGNTLRKPKQDQDKQQQNVPFQPVGAQEAEKLVEDDFDCPVAISEPPDTTRRAMYCKNKVYPGNGKEFSLEELQTAEYMKGSRPRHRKQDQDKQQQNVPFKPVGAQEAEKLVVDDFDCPVAIFEPPDPTKRVMYCKNKVYPGNGKEFSLEELRAAEYMKGNRPRRRKQDQDKQQQNVPFKPVGAQEAEKLVVDDFDCPVAIFEPPDPTKRVMYCKNKVYPGNGKEFSLEELRAAEYMKGNRPRRRKQDQDKQQQNVPFKPVGAQEAEKLVVDDFDCPVAIFEPPDPTKRVMYCKNKVYPGNGKEFSLEELRAAEYMKGNRPRRRKQVQEDEDKHQQNIPFQAIDEQRSHKLVEDEPPDPTKRAMYSLNKVYPGDGREFSSKELRAAEYMRGKTPEQRKQELENKDNQEQFVPLQVSGTQKQGKLFGDDFVGPIAALESPEANKGTKNDVYPSEEKEFGLKELQASKDPQDRKGSLYKQLFGDKFVPEKNNSAETYDGRNLCQITGFGVEDSSSTNMHCKNKRPEGVFENLFGGIQDQSSLHAQSITVNTKEAHNIVQDFWKIPDDKIPTYDYESMKYIGLNRGTVQSTESGDLQQPQLKKKDKTFFEVFKDESEVIKDGKDVEPVRSLLCSSNDVFNNENEINREKHLDGSVKSLEPKLVFRPFEIFSEEDEDVCDVLVNVIPKQNEINREKHLDGSVKSLEPKLGLKPFKIFCDDDEDVCDVLVKVNPKQNEINREKHLDGSVKSLEPKLGLKPFEIFCEEDEDLCGVLVNAVPKQICHTSNSLNNIKNLKENLVVQTTKPVSIEHENNDYQRHYSSNSNSSSVPESQNIKTQFVMEQPDCFASQVKTSSDIQAFTGCVPVVSSPGMTKEEEEALMGTEGKENCSPCEYVKPPREKRIMMGILQPNPNFHYDPLDDPAVKRQIAGEDNIDVTCNTAAFAIPLPSSTPCTSHKRILFPKNNASEPEGNEISVKSDQNHSNGISIARTTLVSNLSTVQEASLECYRTSSSSSSGANTRYTVSSLCSTRKSEICKSKLCFEQNKATVQSLDVNGEENRESDVGVCKVKQHVEMIKNDCVRNFPPQNVSHEGEMQNVPNLKELALEDVVGKSSSIKSESGNRESTILEKSNRTGEHKFFELFNNVSEEDMSKHIAFSSHSRLRVSVCQSQEQLSGVSQNNANAVETSCKSVREDMGDACGNEIGQVIDELSNVKVTEDRQLDILKNEKEIDPFDKTIIQKLLDRIAFPSNQHTENFQQLTQKIPRFRTGAIISLGPDEYSVDKLIGQGSYAKVYKGFDVRNKRNVALKVQKPGWMWEYYICHQIKIRLSHPIMGLAFMDVHKAYSLENYSIIVTDCAQYGSLLSLINEAKQMRETFIFPETLLLHWMIELLNITEALQKCRIIHGDIKPDNFVIRLMPTPDFQEPSLQLIDMGRSIDMTLFPEGTVFKQVVSTKGFQCIEMQTKRPWTYQIDLYGIAGTMYCMYFGDYMKVNKRNGRWFINNMFPRYSLNRNIWEQFFYTLLNVESCDEMPNITELKNLAIHKLLEDRSNGGYEFLVKLLHQKSKKEVKGMKIDLA